MHIALIVPGFSADEDDWCIPALRHLVQRLAETDEVHVLALRYPYRAGRYQLFGAQVTALGGGQRRRWHSVGVWRRGVTALANAHRRHRFDVLHAFWANETGALTALTGRILGVPTLLSLAGGELVGLHDIAYGGQLAPTERFKVRLALQLTTMVTAGSCSLLERARPWLYKRPTGQVHHVPLGVNLRLFRPDVVGRAANDPPRLIHVASLTPVKDQFTLLQAAARLRQSGLTFTLDIAGEGSMESDLKALADKLGLADVVRFWGKIPHHQLPSLYNSGAVFVLSSRYEAQSMAVLEAAACGLPVVGTGVGVVPEFTPEAGIAVPARDPSTMASALAQVLNHEARRSAMGRAARTKVEKEFGLEQCIERFRRLYTALAGWDEIRRNSRTNLKSGWGPGR